MMKEYNFLRGIEEQYREMLDKESEPVYIDLPGLRNFSKNFLREFSNKIYFCNDAKNWVREFYGVKFHKELFKND